MRHWHKQRWKGERKIDEKDLKNVLRQQIYSSLFSLFGETETYVSYISYLRGTIRMMRYRAEFLYKITIGRINSLWRLSPFCAGPLRDYN